jgi:hypothetical protein
MQTEQTEQTHPIFSSLDVMQSMSHRLARIILPQPFLVLQHWRISSFFTLRLYRDDRGKYLALFVPECPPVDSLLHQQDSSPSVNSGFFLVKTLAIHMPMPAIIEPPLLNSSVQNLPCS